MGVFDHSVVVDNAITIYARDCKDIVEKGKVAK